MAPNLKQIALLHDDSFVDASAFLSVIKGHEQRGAEGVEEEEGPRTQPQASSSLSYWDWPAPPAARSDLPSPPVVVDLFSADHLQSNLIRASVEAKKTTTVVGSSVSNNIDHEDYWAERDQSGQDADADMIPASNKVPQHHHPLSVPSVSSDDYWRDVRGVLSEGDSYWIHKSDAADEAILATKTSPPAKKVVSADPVRVFANRCDEKSRKASDLYWDEASSRRSLRKSDAYWNTSNVGTGADVSFEYDAVVARAPVGLRGDSDGSSCWVWSHEWTESDHYWNWESSSPVASTTPPAFLTSC